MHRDSARRRADSSEADAPSEAWLFAQALLGNPIPNPRAAAQRARADQELLDFVASISDRHRDQQPLRRIAEADARRNRELLEWLAPISEQHERELCALQTKEAAAREAQQHLQRLIEALHVQEAQWDPSKHPRLGGPPNAGWFATTGGSSGAIGSYRAPSAVDADSEDDEEFGELTVTPAMVRSSGFLGTIREKLRVAGEIGSAFVVGLGTGAKAVVNGLATAARSAATLGLNTDQLELIGVSKEDRERGYDTAAMISTGSGQVLIAVGTGGMASALAKGGTVARAASGALVAYDSAGNAVGVVQGVYDAAENGVTLANGVQIGAGALGLGANFKAAKGLLKPRAAAPAPDSLTQAARAPTPAKAPATEFRVGKHGDMPSPRPGQHSHHGIMSAWMKKTYSGYDPKNAPTVLMPDTNHRATYGVYLSWRADMVKKTGGTFDWRKVGEADMRSLSEKMFDAAEVPASVREEYWAQFETTKAALQKQQPPHAVEESLWREQGMSEKADVLSVEEMKQWYGHFYESSPKVRLNRANVPERLWPLLPYAEFWGIADDWTREDLIEQAPPEVQRNLKAVITFFNNELEEWLVGPEASNRNPSDEYVAFAAMIMAADFV